MAFSAALDENPPTRKGSRRGHKRKGAVRSKNSKPTTGAVGESIGRKGVRQGKRGGNTRRHGKRSSKR